MKVVLVGIYYPMAILRYFERALKRRTDVELYTAGIYTGCSIPWNGGMLIDRKYATRPDLCLSHQPVPTAYVESQLPWEPDLWININSTWGLQGKPQHGKNFIVGVDPHCIDYSPWRPYADKFFCMQTPYMKSGDVWLPYAYDPECHRDLGLDRTIDAGLVGALYPNRQSLVTRLQRDGFRIEAPGYGAIFDQYEGLCNTFKVGLNWSTQQDLCARVFEVAAMGCAPLVNWVPDLDKMGWTNRVNYVRFDTVEEASDMMSLLLAGDQWKRIAAQAKEFVRPHTWDKRVEEVLSHV